MITLHEKHEKHFYFYTYKCTDLERSLYCIKEVDPPRPHPSLQIDYGTPLSRNAKFIKCSHIL